jgi:AraC family transcriptional regulator of adaptative response/methylated-DNA-[protein]-cysteine methyltransferase
MNIMLPQAEMQRAYLHGDAAYDGIFFIGVKTTGIFCRPICPARKPKPDNVEYFSTAGAALAAGYRACKRCRPLGVSQRPEWAAKLIAEVDADPTRRIRQSDLRVRGIDPATARRYFQKEFGMTFQAYARSRRLVAAFHQIRTGSSIDDAVFESGYESHSGFREAFVRLFGQTPGKLAPENCILLEWLETPLGPLVAGACSAGVCLLEFADRRMLEAQLHTVHRRFGAPLVPGNNQHLVQLRQELSEYFAGSLRQFRVPVSCPGTEFQQRVWAELMRIPFGETRSYEGIAAAVGSPKAVRAVGRANGMNRVAIVIPCHRVVNKNGDLGGYGGGLRRKQYLLDLERQHSC